MKVALRKLPLGYRYSGHFRGLGQDDQTDSLLDSSGLDLSADYLPPSVSLDYSTPTVPLDTLSAPSSGGIPYNLEIGGPGSSTDLNTLILNGTIPPPTGSNLTPAQAAQLSASGATSAQVGQILSGQTSFAQVMAGLASAANAGTQALTSVLAARPSPVTAPVGIPGGGATSYANPLTALESATVIPGVPNFVLGILVVALAAVFAGREER